MKTREKGAFITFGEEMCSNFGDCISHNARFSDSIYVFIVSPMRQAHKNASFLSRSSLNRIVFDVNVPIAVVVESFLI